MPDTQARWNSEAEFFTKVAEETAQSLRPVSPAIRARYAAHRHRIFSSEYRFQVVGDLRGKRVLDVGCGDGQNSSLLALLGAKVDGIDIAPGAIEVARRRAELNGVADRTNFVCAPLETVDFAASTYDVIWCDAILHHLIPELQATVERFRDWVAPGGIVMMAEPVNLSPLLRRLRFAVAADTAHTPDERPLERAELDIIARTLPEVRLRYFRSLGRFDRYIIPDHQYETASTWRRAALFGVSAVDWVALSLPVLKRTASAVVMHARVQKP